MTKVIYLDYAATTPVDPRIHDHILPLLSEKFGNSMSQLHAFGWDAEKLVEESRLQIAQFLNCKSKEIYFTSGASESNNWALQGLVYEIIKSQQEEKIHVISSTIEHKCLLNCLEHLQKLHHVEVDLITPEKNGMINPDKIKEKIRPSTKLISIMWVNNELGTINPIHKIAKLAKENKIYFHSDATQALGKVPIDLQNSDFDLLSFSGHKIYGPKGSGILFKRSQNPVVQLSPLIFGGGQENNLRGGTLNTFAIKGMAKSIELLKTDFEKDINHYQKIKNFFIKELEAAGIEFKINGDLNHTVSNILNITFLNRSGLPLNFTGLAISRGSACSSQNSNSSHVLNAIGISENLSNQTIRFSFGRMTTMEEINEALEVIKLKLIKPKENLTQK